MIAFRRRFSILVAAAGMFYGAAKLPGQSTFTADKPRRAATLIKPTVRRVIGRIWRAAEKRRNWPDRIS